MIKLVKKLHSLHELGFVHGDLKLKNIVVKFPENNSADIEVRLIDFSTCYQNGEEIEKIQ